MAFLDLKGLQYFYSKVIAKLNTLIPAKTSQLTNDSGYITESNIDDAYMKKNADSSLDMGYYNISNIAGLGIDADLGVIRFSYPDITQELDIYPITDDSGNVAFEVYDNSDNVIEQIMQVSINGGSIRGYDIHTDANSTKVIVTEDNSTTPDVNSYGLWAY